MMVTTKRAALSMRHQDDVVMLMPSQSSNAVSQLADVQPMAQLPKFEESPPKCSLLTWFCQVLVSAQPTGKTCEYCIVSE